MIVLIWLGALSVLAVAASAYAPKSTFVTDTLSHFVLQGSISAALLILLAILNRVSGPVYLVLLLTYFLCVGRMWPFLIKGKKPPGLGTKIKLLQVNVLRTNKGTAPLRALIRDENPDIIAVMEVNGAYEEMLRAQADVYPHQHILADYKTSWGIAVLSKWPLEALEVRYLGDPTIPSVFCKVTVDGRIVDVAAVHAHNPMKDFAARDREMAGLAAWFEKEQPAHLIVTGDFNATPYCAALRDMTRRMQLRSARDGRSFLGTFPVYTQVPFLRLPIDHTLVSEGLIVADFRLGPDIGSDHFPTLTEIRW